MELLIITGLSGSGKSRTVSILEDIGYYIVDNLPAEIMVKFADFCAASNGTLRFVFNHTGADEKQRSFLPYALP